MVRILFTALLFIHGLIHLIGFYSEWKLGSSSMLSGNTLFALNGSAHTHFWRLLAYCRVDIDTASTILYFLKKDSFWIPALVAIVISQLLIVFYWHDAKFGTIANVIVLIVVIINIARTNLQQKSRPRVVDNVRSDDTMDQARGQTLKASLPPDCNKMARCLEEYRQSTFENSSTQDGTMRSKPSADWMSFSAVQHYTIRSSCIHLEFSNQRRNDDHRRSGQIWKRKREIC